MDYRSKAQKTCEPSHGGLVEHTQVGSGSYTTITTILQSFPPCLQDGGNRGAKTTSNLSSHALNSTKQLTVQQKGIVTNWADIKAKKERELTLAHSTRQVKQKLCMHESDLALSSKALRQMGHVLSGDVGGEGRTAFSLTTTSLAAGGSSQRDRTRERAPDGPGSASGVGLLEKGPFGGVGGGSAASGLT
jgi:hypothetical protein